MEDSMKTNDLGWEEKKRDKYALLALSGYGAGEIVGAILYGRI